MSIAKKIIGQSGIYFGGTLFSIGIGFFFKMYIAQELGADMLGIYALGLSIVTILSTFLSWGLGNGLIKFVSKYIAIKDYIQLHTYLRRTFELTLVLSLIAALIFFIFPEFISTTLLNTPALTSYMPFFGILIVVNALVTLADQTIRGLQEVKKSTIIGQFIRLPVKISIAVLLVYTGFELRGYLLAEIIAAIIAMVLLGRLVVKLLPNNMLSLKKRAAGNILKEERRFGNNMLIMNTVGLLQGQGDKILLAIYLSTTDLGIYSIVLALTAFVPTILVSVNSIFTPIISQLYSENKIIELRRYYQLSSKYIFVLTFPLIAFLAVFSEQVLRIFGEEFKSGGFLLLLILIGELINNSTGSIGMMLSMMGLEKQMRNISILSSLFTFILYVVLTSTFGILGLGTGIIISKFLMNLSSVYVLKIKRDIIAFEYSYLKAILIYIFLSTLLAVLLNLLPLSEITIPLLICSFIFLYGLYLGTYLLITGKRDIIALRQLLIN
jgi:O-antigen/teichoic acid export membrane protein